VEIHGVDRPKRFQSRTEESQEIKYAIHPVTINADGAIVELEYMRFVNVHTEESATKHEHWISDTNDETDNSFDNRIHKLGLGRRFRARVTPEGKVVAAPSVRDELQLMLMAMGKLNKADRADAIDRIRSRFGKRSTVTTLDQIFSTYPEEKIGIGDCWKKPYLLNFTTATSGASWLKANSTSCLHDVAEEVGKDGENKPIKYHMTAEDHIYTIQANAKKTYDWIMQGTQNFTQTIDAETGWPKIQKTVLHYDGDHHFFLGLANRPSRLKMVMHYTVDSTSTIEIETDEWKPLVVKADPEIVDGDSENEQVRPNVDHHPLSERIDKEGELVHGADGPVRVETKLNETDPGG